MRWRAAIVAVLLGSMAASAFAATSHAQLWSALGNNAVCGVAIHTGSQPQRLLCSSPPIPPPTSHGVGDPGFVFLAASGRPSLARLSQDTFAGSHAVALAAGAGWSDAAIGVTCTVSASAVRCSNRAGHGFTISRHSYRSF